MGRIFLAGTAQLAPSAAAIAQIPGPGRGVQDWMWSWGPWAIVMPLLLLFLILAVVGVVALIHYFWPDIISPESHRALDLLDERYARGEIDRDEYLQRRRDLGRR
jgi:putative membrane protein